jgi:flagellar assembly factor FliW
MANIKLNTRFGELDVEPSRIITFPKGLPGFEDYKRWTLFHEINEKGEPVCGVVIHLQSLDNEKVMLSLTEPNLFGFNYELVLTDSEVAELKVESAHDVLVLTTLSEKDVAARTLSAKDVVPKIYAPLSSEDIYANLTAPILINIKSRLGMQKILVPGEATIGFRTAIGAVDSSKVASK